MAYTKKRGGFRDEQEAADTRQMLVEMTQSGEYNTGPSYSSDTETYPDHVISFVDKHMRYIRTHSVEPRHYLSNLRLMTRIR